MTRSIRLTILSTLSLSLMACGGAKLGGGKQGAAQAAFQASQPTAHSKGQTAALLSKAVASGATLGIVLDCAKHGSATLGLDLSSTHDNTGSTDAIYYSVKYAECNQDGRNQYDGTLSSSLSFPYDPTFKTLAFVTTMKGKLNISGEVSDSIDSDLTLTMQLTSVDASSGDVKLVLDGTIKTSDGTYTYTHEAVSITAGVLPHG